MVNLRNGAWLAAVITAVVACAAYGQVTQSFDAPSPARVWLFAVIGVSGIGMVLLSRPVSSLRDYVLLLWIPALLMRIALLPTAPSDDIHRYLWEGRMFAEGRSPYAAPADDPIWQSQRDAQWQAMNHKDKPTAYPPLAEWAFATVSSIAYDPIAFKIFFIAIDLLTMGGVLALLRQRGLASGFVGLYAFSPVVLIAYAGEAHFDVLMVAALVWALVAHGAGRHRWAVALASVATGIKWVTLPLIPLFAGRRLFSGALVALAVLAIPALCFWETLPQLVQGLFEFGATRSFNGPIYESLLWLGCSRALCSGMVVVTFLAVVLWRGFLHLSSSRRMVDGHIRWILGALIVLSPTVHFWYLAWILPFVCLRPSLPWLTFAVSCGIYFCVWLNAADGVWMLHPWQKVAFWLPFLLACLYELWSTRGRVIFPLRIVEPPEEGTVAVVIPTLNVEGRIDGALASIAAQEHPVTEVILADGGSRDGTLQRAAASSLPIRVVSSECGRGQQIAAGIEAAEANWVIVLHADAALNPASVSQLLKLARNNTDLVGGAFGQRFDHAVSTLLPIELLNDLRALFTRTAFGDQTQFFHRATAVARGLMPKQPLMEDVESSWRVRECGAFLYIGQPTRVCHRRWQGGAWLRRFALVMRLVGRYRVARLQSRATAAALSADLYKEYYRSGK